MGWARAFRLGVALLAVTIASTACGRYMPTSQAATSPPTPKASAKASAKTPVATSGICTSAKYPQLAAQISAGIKKALAGRSSVVAITADDASQDITCQLHQWWPIHSASVVKVIILGALLHELMPGDHDLTPEQITLTHEMITESDNDAASALWDEVGMANLQSFLNAAKMTHTELGQGGLWGLTDVNAHDEMLLLQLLTTNNTVLDEESREYALQLMADVIPSQRWGAPAGAPSNVTVHVKNGWLPDPDLWVINSLGDFTSPDGDNPSMGYGISTVQAAAEVINHDLNQK